MSGASFAPPAFALLLFAAGCAADGAPPVPGPVPDASADASTGAPITTAGNTPMTDPVTEDTEGAGNAAPMTDAAPDAPPDASARALRLSARAADPRSAIDAPLRLHVEARNATSADAELLLWNTPFERVLSADVFRVSRDGEPVEYRGRLVKRAPPPGDDAIVRVMPGETLSRVVDLSLHYAVDVPGTYTVELDPGPVPIDDGTAATARFATLVPADAAPIVIERR